MDPTAPNFLVKRLAQVYSAGGDVDLARDSTEAADRARCLLLACSKLLLLPNDQPRRLTALKNDAPADIPTETGAARRAARSRLYSTLGACVDALSTSTDLRQLCFRGCVDPTDNAAIDSVALRCTQHAVARQGTSRTMTQLHSQMWEGARVKTVFQEEYCRTSALVMTKDWNLGAHEWCTTTAREFFLLDHNERKRWLARDPVTRSLITALAPEMRRRMKASRAGADSLTPRARATTRGRHTIAHDVAALLLPKLDTRLRLVDIGCCKNFFGERYPELFETIALDLCPADKSVFECDFLDLEIVADASQGVDARGQPASEGLSAPRAKGAGRLKWLTQHSFDVAVISQVLSFIPDPDARALIVEKARKLLRGGETGILLVVEPARVLRHAGAQLIAAIEARGFRHLPGFRYERRGEAGVGLAFATMPLGAEMEACEVKPALDLPAHPGHVESKIGEGPH